MTDLPALDFAALREETVGIDCQIETPFGERLMVYCDYTASGRCLGFIERYLQSLQRHYANTHTEDDITGRSMTQLLHSAEAIIKRSVNAGPQGRIIAVGTGATGAIDRFQQLVGVAYPPVTGERLLGLLGEFMGPERLPEFHTLLAERRPVVFIGPYEHHSNEVTWRQGIATVVEVSLDDDGGIDLVQLEELLQREEWQKRLRIGSFSAASNVTGRRTPVREIAALLHRHDALACFDYAASAPYVPINMNPPAEGDSDSSLDAIFLSPHKFLGGPGSPGILVFNEKLYRRDLPPTIGGGGTVAYVGPHDHDYVDDIEEREKAGTPGVLQMMKAALAFQVREAVGLERIEAREAELVRTAIERLAAHDRIEILGHPDPEKRVGIISFNIRSSAGRYLHPKFVTVLLNDLFGIQSRAGCSCAGPYGHRLLGIDEEASERYRNWVREGYEGIKPGWCRIGLHYAMDDAEADYVISAVEFVADRGHCFLPLYEFDPATGSWSHRDQAESREDFGLGAALASETSAGGCLAAEVRTRLYASYLEEAGVRANETEAAAGDGSDAQAEPLLDGRFGDLQFFST